MNVFYEGCSWLLDQSADVIQVPLDWTEIHLQGLSTRLYVLVLLCKCRDKYVAIFQRKKKNIKKRVSVGAGVGKKKDSW